MNKLEILEKLDFGNSIAEYDDNISHYYINTPATLDIVNDRYDIIKGTKGSGKTAMLVAICSNQQSYSQLQGKLLIKAIQLKGDPDFQRAFSTVTIDTFSQQQLIDAWKIYLINVLWHNYGETFSDSSDLLKYLQQHKILDNKRNALENIIYALKFVKLKASNTMKSDGSAIQSIEVLASDNITPINSNEKASLIDFNYIFSELDILITSKDSCFWVLIDRLDDAFPDNTKNSTLILKSLFYAYKDICFYKGFKIKIFIRNDIFRIITQNGFTSLTHVSSKTMSTLKWDRANLEQLIVERLLFNDEYKKYLDSLNINTNIDSMSSSDRIEIINTLIKPQIDIGKNNPDSIGWIINHVKDGKGIFTPRDVISLLDNARTFQLQYLQKNNLADVSDNYLLSQNAIREAYKKISKEKLVTQIYAEYPKCRAWIENFINHKSELTNAYLEKILGKHWKYRSEVLTDIGFLEKKANSYKIPFIYRVELNIIQGKEK